MRNSIFFTIIAALSAAVSGNAIAQFGLSMQLPREDFVWTWGTDLRRGINDLSVLGSEQGFRCDLQVKFRISSALGRDDERAIEQSLRSSMFFVQEVAYRMNELDAYNYLDWAVLDCKRPENDDTEEEIAEREAKALERAQRARERRRARAREEDD